MSNLVCIQPTKFENLRDGSVSYGYRIYDNYDGTYYNLEDTPLPDDDMELLKCVIETGNDSVHEMIEYVRENEEGIEIGDVYYEWDVIKDIVGED